MKRPHTVLVVDDEPDVVQSVQGLLRLEFRVLGATRAKEGLEIMRREEVHVVMTDHLIARRPAHSEIQPASPEKARSFPGALSVYYPELSAAERDLYVVTEVRRRGVPLTLVLSGGYGPLSWEAHARSIEGILARFDREGVPGAAG